MHKIIIDGFNLLFNSRQYPSKLNDGKRIIDHIKSMLQEFQSFPYKIKKRLVFVFDGSDIACGNPKQQSFLGFKVIFSAQGKSADQKIIDMVRKSNNPKSILVVTNDNAIISHVCRYGAKTNKLHEFSNWVDKLTTDERDTTELDIKKFEPKLSENEVDDWVDYFSRDTR